MLEKNHKHRLMIITHDLAIGGLQRVIVNICRTINRNVFDLSVLCLRSRGEFTDEIEQMGIKVFHSYEKENEVNYFPFFKIARILKKEKVEIIHTHNTQPFIEGTIAGLIAGVKTIIHTDHARKFPDKKRYMFFEWLVSNFVYKVVGVSEHTSNNLIKYEMISTHKLITIMNGIDEDKFRISINKMKKRQELGIGPEGGIIGLGVRLTEQKGITYLLNAMTIITKHFPDITLLIAGEGPLEKDLKTEAKRLGIEQNVKFIGPRLDMPEIMKLLDIYVLPSLWEGLPMVLLEAMAAECPIIATDVGGNSMAIESDYNGKLVQPKSPIDLSDAVIDLLRDEKKRLQYIERSRELFDKKFSARVMTAQYERLYLRRSI